MFRTLSIAVLMAAILAGAVACKKGSSDLLKPDLDDGVEGGLCFDDGSCNEGLVCEEGFCLAAAAGEAGAACLADGSCNEGLVCEGAVCIEPVAAGEEGGVCRDDGTCDAGLVCESDVCVAGPAVGEKGGACYSDGTCDEGLACANDLCVKIDIKVLDPVVVERIERPVPVITVVP